MANETLQQILSAQNTYIQNGEAARARVEGKVDSALTNLSNDDAAITALNNRLIAALTNLDNDDAALTALNNRLITALLNLSNDDAALTALNGKVDTALTFLNKAYSFNHADGVKVTATLENLYDAILAADAASANPLGLSERPAVGFTAILSPGDEIKTFGNLLYINGTASGDYTFTGTFTDNGQTVTAANELVQVWYFGNPYLNLSETPAISIVEIDEKLYDNGTDLNENYFKITNVQKWAKKRYLASGVINCISYEIENNNVTDTQTVLWNKVNFRKLVDGCKIYSGSISNNGNDNTIVESVDLPNAEEITFSSNYGAFAGLKNQKLTITFPKLTKVTGDGSISTPANQKKSTFYGNPVVYLPASVNTVIGGICCENNTIRLDCKNAASIAAGWCVNAPAYFYMCGDWGATINISIGAGGWTAAQFIDLMTNKLRDWTLPENGGYTANGAYQQAITIPASMLTTLAGDADGAAAIAEANRRLWDVTGG